MWMETTSARSAEPGPMLRMRDNNRREEKTEAEQSGERKGLGDQAEQLRMVRVAALQGLVIGMAEWTGEEEQAIRKQE